MQPIIFQCPGKVLLVGGYAILNEKNHGLSLAVNKKMYACLEQQKSDECSITFECQQFKRRFKFIIGANGEFKCDQSNKYLSAIVQVIVENKFEEFKNLESIVRIFIDPEFYSFDIDHFQYIGDLDNTSKTGLGSSSALIVCCLGTLCKKIDIELAMKANIIAQAKIGSGFDISTCISGSQIFLRSKYSELIPQRVEQFQLPKQLKLIMVDLNLGQNTIQSVKSFTKYLNQNPDQHARFLVESENIFNSVRISLMDQDFKQLKIVNRIYRQLLREFGTMSECEIEPDISTSIIDLMMENEEVVYGICPGAGGYDAMAFLVNKDVIDVNLYQSQLDSNTFKFGNQSPEIRCKVKDIGIDYQGFSQLLQNQPAYELINELLKK